jgi:hypothetical protein
MSRAFLLSSFVDVVAIVVVLNACSGNSGVKVASVGK